MKRVILVVGTVLLIAAADPSIRELADAVAKLADRVTTCESGLASLTQHVDQLALTPGPAPKNKAPSTTDSVMQLQSIEVLAPDPDVLAKADSMLKDADKLRAEAEAKRADAARLSDDQKRLAKKDEYSNQIATLQRQATDLTSKADSKNAQALRLQRDAKEPRQLIRGWDGQNEIVLETTKDLSRQLSAIGIGGYLTWRGMLVAGAQGDEHRYTVASVAKVDKPAGFRDLRP